MMSTPKIELHVHLEGTIRPATLLSIARRNRQPLPADDEAGLRALYRYTSYKHFIEVWTATTHCLRTRDDYRQVAVDYAAEAASFGAVYLEAIFSPCGRVARGVAWADIFGGYCDGAQEAYERHGVTIRLTPDINRGGDPELAVECAKVAVRHRDQGVVGFGIGGSERLPVTAYRRAFEVAREGGLALVPHAGEWGGPGRVREVLDLAPARIRHGVRVVDDPGLLAEIAARGIVLDVCPTSNLRTGVIKQIADHPLPLLRAAGVLCTINTDDPAMFDTDLGHEHAIARQLGVNAADAYTAGLAGALCEEPVRRRLVALARRCFS